MSASNVAAVTSSLDGGKQNLPQNVAPIPAIASQHGNLKRKQNAVKMVMFQGRDTSYPDELNQLIQPLSCLLCKTQMTSIKNANDHYESKPHDRHISAWLAKNYTDMGLETPLVKRLIRDGPTGPNAFHCELCDLPLTSSTHARQHYNGRKHLLVQQRGSKPSGAGYYDDIGKWVRTGTRAEPRVKDNAMQIEVLGSNGQQSLTTATTSTSLAAIDDALSCKICGISVSSASQIKMHLDGIKHQKNLIKHNMQDELSNGSGSATSTSTTSPSAIPIVAPLMATALTNPELAMHRTPSGSYYCKLCNKAMNHISILQQHLKGRKHLRALQSSLAAEGAGTGTSTGTGIGATAIIPK